LLKGLPVATLQEILGEAMETVLRPLLFAEPLELLERPSRCGEPTYIVSASLHEIVQYVADDLGFDGAVGSTCEIVDGVFTGVSLQPCYGPLQGAGRPPAGGPGRARARGVDRVLPTPPATSPSSRRWAPPIAINPDRKLRRIAGEPPLARPPLQDPRPASDVLRQPARRHLHKSCTSVSLHFHRGGIG
jgi:hypothetical protein